jgi:hypothetical protein
MIRKSLFDSHVHFGQFMDTYYTPPRVVHILERVGVTGFAGSSTSAVVTDDPGFMREEREAMLDVSGGRALPLLWVTFSMLRRSPDLSKYLDFNVRGFKVHGGSEPWAPFGARIRRVFDIARELKLPVQLHTGERGDAFAGEYLKICEAYPDVRVDLAHGRPLNETVRVLRACGNAYVDTAFMPHGHLKILLSLGFADRILYGSDSPIPGRSLKSSLRRYLERRIRTSKKIAGKDWEKISAENPARFWMS